MAVDLTRAAVLFREYHTGRWGRKVNGASQWYYLRVGFELVRSGEGLRLLLGNQVKGFGQQCEPCRVAALQGFKLHRGVELEKAADRLSLS